MQLPSKATVDNLNHDTLNTQKFSHELVLLFSFFFFFLHNYNRFAHPTSKNIPREAGVLKVPEKADLVGKLLKWW